jgi:hypothetical protein
MRPTPTPLDYKWLHQQVTRALQSAGDAPAITLERPAAELMVCVLDIAGDGGRVRPARAARYQFDEEDLHPAVIHELQRLARNGEAPSKARWDQQRQSQLPSAQHCCRILATPWAALCQEAGLTLNRYAQRWAGHSTPASAAPAAGDDEDEGEDAPILTEDDYIRDWPTVAQRNESFIAGGVRVTREYHTLR